MMLAESAPGLKEHLPTLLQEAGSCGTSICSGEKKSIWFMKRAQLRAFLEYWL